MEAHDNRRAALGPPRRPWEVEPDGEAVDVRWALLGWGPSRLGLGCAVVAGLAAVATGSAAAVGLGVAALAGSAGWLGFVWVAPRSRRVRDAVLLWKRRDRRARARVHLAAELRRVDRASPRWAAYERMCATVGSLRALARAHPASVARRDLERLDDATVDYLGMWLSEHLMRAQHRDTDERALRAKVRAIEQQLAHALPEVERAQLDQARADLRAMIERHQGLDARATALEVELLAMADRCAELYQRAVADPRGDLAGDLADAVGRLRVEEALEVAVDAELAALLRRNAETPDGSQ